MRVSVQKPHRALGFQFAVCDHVGMQVVEAEGTWQFQDTERWEENTSGSGLWRVGRGIRPESQFLPESALRYQLLQQQRLSHTVSIVTMSECWVLSFRKTR